MDTRDKRVSGDRRVKNVTCPDARGNRDWDMETETGYVEGYK